MSDIIISSLDIQTQERVEIHIQVQIPVIIIEDTDSNEPDVAASERQTAVAAPERETAVATPQRQPDVASPQRQPDVAAPQRQPDVAAPQRQPDVAAPQRQPDVAAPERQPDVDAPERQPDVAAPERQPAVAAPERQPAVAAPERQPDVAAPERQPDVDAPERQPDVAAPERQPDVDAPERQPDVAASEIWEVKKVDDVSVFKKRETMDDSATLPLTGKGLEIPGQVWKELQRPTEYVCYFMYNNKDNSKATLTVTSILSQTSSRWQLIIIHDNKLEPLDIPQNQQIEVLHSEDIGLSRAYQLAMLHCQYTLCCPVPAGIQLLPDTTQTILNSYRRGPENTFYYWAPGPADGVSASPLKNGSFKSGQALCTFRHISYYLTEGFIYEEHHQAIADLAYKLEYYCYPARLEGPLYLAGEGTANSKVSSTITCRTLQEITHLQHIALRHPATSATLQWQATKDVAMIKIGNNTYYLGHIPGKILGNNLRWVHTKGVYESVGGPGTFSLAALLDTLGPGRHINHYFDMVYVINLQKDSKKRRRMTRIFESYNIDFRFFPAIYGMQQPYYGQFLRQYTQQLWNPGAYGYTLSVINVLKDAIRNGYQRILVCDDDLILCKNFNKRFHDVIEQIPEDWQLLYFGLSGPLTPYINDGFRDYRFRVPYITDTGKCDGSFCLGYHHSVFNQVLKMALEFSGPFDTALNRYYLTEHPEIRKYVLYPYLVTADMTSSDIAPREKSIMDNYSAYQYRYRINIGNFDVDKKEQEPRQLKETFDLLRIEQEPLVTVIFYNYNQDALRSILCQTYTNLEVIVMCDNYTQRDLSEARVQIINNERPIGMVNCFRKALALSHGTYITMHHMDYRSEPERIATVLLAMQTGGLNVCATRSERDKKHFYLTGVIAKRGYTLVIENILRHLNGVLPVTVINRMLYYPAPTTTQSLCNIPQTLGRRRKTGKRR